ncbi:hypothetical protein BN2476_1500010 [Paraburkholderia piptadeniae]|uniref:Uncharacterized protein n=1 Tax=Paraburkholderia piptadeniae TaxID=1701573 RepID=A0A1N7SWS8_9BURK|nr:hypothetical protein BN2476_1500010 [Paraburkholderia piptadeniae]
MAGRRTSQESGTCATAIVGVRPVSDLGRAIVERGNSPLLVLTPHAGRQIPQDLIQLQPWGGRCGATLWTRWRNRPEGGASPQRILDWRTVSSMRDRSEMSTRTIWTLRRISIG